MGRLAPSGSKTDLAICAACGSDMAALGDWGEATDTTYYLHILCGNCHVWRYVEATDADCQWWEAAVIEGYMDVLYREANKCADDHFKDWCAIFICALKHDAILPEDF